MSSGSERPAPDARAGNDGRGDKPVELTSSHNEASPRRPRERTPSPIEVLAIQQRAKSLLLEGKTIMNWNDAETSVSKQFTLPVDQVLEECGHALRVLDPETYGKPRTAAASFISLPLPMKWNITMTWSTQR